MVPTARIGLLILLISSLHFGESTCLAQTKPAEKKPYTPFIAPASDEGRDAMAGFKIPPGFKISLFAAEPMLANPVSFSIDEKNRFYVVETFRRKSAVIDTRQVMHWLDDDTASRTVAMRIAMVKKFRDAAGVADMTKDSERVQRIEDRDGDGKADFASVYAEGFNRLEDGIAAGVLARGDDVWFGDVPSLWKLRDTNGDAVADVRDELQYGYGVRYAFNGHDLHGLRFGPDGKLYFSMGDRALHVEKTPDGRTVSNPDSGAVLRCNPDGTELELFATGLRNPQELAFDKYGNLFTGDNNADGGDKARWVYVVEGGDTGWRIGYQANEWPVKLGPWNAEGIWMTNPPYPAAYIVPPVIELDASGPSGLTVDPGTGLPPEFAGRFFLADFRGGPTNSSVHAIKVEPKGASFEVVEQKPIIGGVLCTDVEIGWDGMYISDWTNGWLTTGKGRLYHLWNEEAQKNPLVAETRKLMSEGMGKRPVDELVKLLSHADQRVRQAAQFELVDRKEIEPLKKVSGDTSDQIARFHAIWGIGQLARKTPSLGEAIVPLLSDKDDEVRTQAAKVLGEVKFEPGADALEKAIGDPSPRVKFYATLGVGKLESLGASMTVIEMIRMNADQDAYLRHAGVFALSKLVEPRMLAELAQESNVSVRMACQLALRRQHSPLVAKYLNDQSPKLVLETARAINDVPIEEAMPKLAALITKANLEEPVMTRVLNANYRAGTPEAAKALAEFAKASGGKEYLRVEALRMLGAWDKVPGRDRVTGIWRPTPDRDPKIAKDAAGPVLPEILRTAPESVRIAAAGLLTKMGLGDPELLAELAGDEKLSADLRSAALAALSETKSPLLATTVEQLLSDDEEPIRAAAIRALGRLEGSYPRLAAVMNDGSVREKQAALLVLGTEKGAEAEQLIGSLLDSMLTSDAKNPVAPELRLDVLDAAEARKSPALAAKREQYLKVGDASDLLAPFRDSLAGGDAKLGEVIFRERADVSCMRCHSISKKGGNAGPDLAGVGIRLDRPHILESIVMPGKVIAQGFETIAVRMKDGAGYAGTVKEENEQVLHLDVPDKGYVTLDKSQIKSRRGGMSGMPDNIAQTLSKQDMRNLIEFLSSQTQPPAKVKAKGKKKDAPEAGHGIADQ